MYLDYSKLSFDTEGRPRPPRLVLQTLDGSTIGTLSGISNLSFTIKYAEVSELSFEVPYQSDGVKTPFYDRIEGHKLIWTEEYGIYVTVKPKVEGDGIQEVKTVTGYSLEYLLSAKRFFMEEGTFNFWNPASQTDTVLSRILEKAPGWSVGYVAPSLIGCYRTFDQYDADLVSFIYTTAPEKYRCVFVFDVYEKTISAYAADDEVPSLPIYLDFHNLLESVSVEERTDDLVTALSPYGADELDITGVNPIGTNWLYDLTHFIANGDLSPALADKWQLWQNEIYAKREQYAGLTALRASARAQQLAAQAALTDLENERTNLVGQQNVIIQAYAMETTDEGKATQQAKLDVINAQIAEKDLEIATKEADIATLTDEIEGSGADSYSSQISAINKELAFFNFFTEEEQAALDNYLVESVLTEDTFVATDVDTTYSGVTSAFNSGTISVSGTSFVQIDISEDRAKYMYTLSGGTLSIAGDLPMTADIIRGTIELRNDGTCVLSSYIGTANVDGSTLSSGVVCLTGSWSNFSSDVHQNIIIDGLTQMIGTAISMQITGASLFLSVNVSEYQKYSVQQELYDYAQAVLADKATPTYEVSVDAANFLFLDEYAPFRNKMELGKALYLRINEDEVIQPIAIEMAFEFEDMASFSLVFSNQFKRNDNVATLQQLLEEGSSASRTLSVNKYIYGKAVDTATEASIFMNSTLDAARNRIIAASDESVSIDGGGIQVGTGDGKYKLRLVGDMLAMTDDDWATAKLAIGRFATEAGEFYGINTQVLAGNLVITNNFMLENTNDAGVMQFKVDGSGAWLNNSTFILQKDNGGKIIIDPKYGIVAGEGNLFTTEGTTVTPSFIDEDGDVTLDSDGFPTNSNFFLDINTGDAYLRGTVKATDGSIGGWTLGDNRLYSGTSTSYVALNASTSTDSLYAIWAGAANPGSAPFSVMRDGTLKATNGTFSGTLSAAKVSGVLSAATTGSWLEGCGIRVGGSGTLASGYNFYVDTSGNVTINGNLTLKSGAITWSSLDTTTKNSINTAATNASDAVDTAKSASTTANSALTVANSANSTVSGWVYSGTTQINGAMIRTGTVTASTLQGGTVNILSSGGNTVGVLTPTWSSSSDIALQIGSRGALRLIASNGSVHVESSSGRFLQCADSYISSGGNFRPSTGGTYSCGTSGATWSQIYAASGTVTTSDREKKQDINYDMTGYNDLFDKIRPVNYKFVDGTSGRTHVGMVSQDVEEALDECNMSSSDFAGFIKSPKTDDDGNEIEGYDYALRYEEFIALCIDQIQKLKTRVDELEQK